MHKQLHSTKGNAPGYIMCLCFLAFTLLCAKLPTVIDALLSLNAQCLAQGLQEMGCGKEHIMTGWMVDGNGEDAQSRVMGILRITVGMELPEESGNKKCRQEGN